jgi:phage terminase large subunit-like protein
MKHPAHTYALKVRSGEIVAGKLVKKAVERYFDDLETGIDRGLYFDSKKAARACRFFPKYLRHSKGKWSGKVFELEPWQAFIIWNIFGWYTANGKRRFHTAYIEVARKNGKSTFAAGTGLYMMVADDEMGAEIYVGATKQKQAKVTFDEAKNMVKKSPELREYIIPFRNNLHSEELMAKFEPLGQDSDTEDGLNAYCGIIDEYHAHKDDSLYNVIESGMGARENPLMFVITTAGFNKLGPCKTQRDLCEKILNGIIQQDDIFAMIFSMDEEDDWENSNNWIKANPSMNSIDTTRDFLHSRYERVKNDPSKHVDFLTKNLNVWTDASEVWIQSKRWDACNIKPIKWEDLAGRQCFGGLDLASVEDITCAFLFFPGEAYHDLYPLFFIPEETVRERTKRDKVPYEQWVREGWIETTPGDTVDYDYIRRRLTGYYVEDGEVKHDESCVADHVLISSIAFDRWNSSQLVNNLMADGIQMSPFGQGFVSMSTPTKEFKKLVLKKQVNHGGNPVLTWMISNVEIKCDAGGNEKIDKGASKEKVDGPVAGVMALGEYLTEQPESDDIFEVLTA